ncbi:uncharacterized protein AKAME5_001268300 [Lates japonicus]|uniref:Uncharacterized protein n=1 Tax=Lates japonicus TaxID=270547 RepID=A0AAD3MW92_LATJO|nr:uncharacterized protein AKAME5_001268300 [Lates japonicus]
MEEPSTIPEKDTRKRMENNSNVKDQTPRAESANRPASGCEATSKTESKDQLRLFATLLMVRVLTQCQALKNRSQEEWVPHTKRLVNQTMEGLTISEGFCPHTKSIKKICKAALKDLRKKFCGRRILESVILLQDPGVDTIIVQSLQVHIKQHSARLAKKAASQSIWKDIRQVTVFSASLLAALVLLAFIH